MPPVAGPGALSVPQSPGLFRIAIGPDAGEPQQELLPPRLIYFGPMERMQRRLAQLPALGFQVAVLILAVFGLGLLWQGTAIPVRILVDGVETELHTRARTVGAVLREAGIELEAGDRVSPRPDSALDPSSAIQVERARLVRLDLDGEILVLRTPERVPLNILREVGAEVFPSDRLWAEGILLQDPAAELLAPPASLLVQRGFQIELALPEQSRILYSSAPTVGEALEENGIILREGDLLEPAADTPLQSDLQVDLRPSKSIRIQVDGDLIQTRATGTTVGEALSDAGVALLGLDYSLPPLDAPLPSDGEVRIVRVDEQLIVEQEPVPFDTVFEADPELEIDNQRILDPGTYGIEANRIRLRFEDGLEVERIEEGTWQVREPEPKRVGYGTRIEIRSASTADGPIEYWRAIEMWATSYSPSRAGVSPDAPNFGITASGLPLTKGLVAIDRSLIPFGTRLYIPGYGFAIAADTGGGVRGRWIDLGYDDDNWVSWARYVTVYFLTPVPPPEGIVWIFP